MQLRDAPEHKRLVIGNHDMNPLGEIEEDGFDIGTDTTIYAPACPPLLLTHVPLPKVPIGTVNVHGHYHDRPSPGRLTHISVSVEQTAYCPLRLSRVRIPATAAGLAAAGVP